ncbi:Retinoic acid-induced protein 3 [Galemys pyrenaicus]|uniref:Retinoic acid-induced protein 3 n=1 Tax=Galemys pyrenaicus TaxID=202257 RepID=A0A8J6A8N2_GALPY|nr:Retinoic acid-induced protein 3 [Galemys pyrenaicus]
MRLVPPPWNPPPAWRSAVSPAKRTVALPGSSSCVCEETHPSRPLLLCRTTMASTAPPATPFWGCHEKLAPKYHRLCDTSEVWGIVLEAVAALGAVTSVGFLLALLVLVCKVQDSNKRKLLPTQFLFLLGVLGVFGLTFAFIIQLDKLTGPTRFFLFGVLFSLCFSCLLAHAFNLTRLVRGRAPLSLLVMLALAVGLSLVQDIIAVEYVVLTMNKTDTAVFLNLPSARRNEDFVLLLTYVMFLMALTFLTSSFTFCGSFAGWKRHGAHICITSLLSVGLWAAWIALLLVPAIEDRWDDTILASALVANGWVFLLAYVVPEFQLLTKQRNPTDYPMDDAFCKPQLMKQSFGVENRAYAQEEAAHGLEDVGDTLYAPYSTHFQLQKQRFPTHVGTASLVLVLQVLKPDTGARPPVTTNANDPETGTDGDEGRKNSRDRGDGAR